MFHVVVVDGTGLAPGYHGTRRQPPAGNSTLYTPLSFLCDHTDLFFPEITPFFISLALASVTGTVVCSETCLAAHLIASSISSVFFSLATHLLSSVIQK